MPVTDPIADLLTRIRNANMAYHDSLELDSSKIKIEVCRILKEEGYIKGFELIDAQPQPKMKVFMKFGPRRGPTRERAITNLKRISKPGLRIYRKAADLKPVLRGFGIAIISTSKGLMTDRDARKQGFGGEVIAEVW